MSIEFKRGMIFSLSESKENHANSMVIISSNSMNTLAIDLYDMSAEEFYETTDDVELVSEEFACEFFCKELGRVIRYFPLLLSYPTSSLQYESEYMKLIATLDDRGIGTILKGISLLFSDDNYRVFLCENAGKPHKFGYWSDPKVQEEFLDDYERQGTRYVCEKYNLSYRSAAGYKYTISKKLGRQVNKKVRDKYWDDPNHMRLFLNEFKEHGPDYVGKKYRIKRSTVYGYRKQFRLKLGMREARHPKTNLDLFKDNDKMIKFMDDFYFHGAQTTAEMYSITIKTLYQYRVVIKKKLMENGIEYRLPEVANAT